VKTKKAAPVLLGPTRLSERQAVCNRSRLDL
jgi:hypothetical protein